jgi:hypothetical protein
VESDEKMTMNSDLIKTKKEMVIVRLKEKLQLIRKETAEKHENICISRT